MTPLEDELRRTFADLKRADGRDLLPYVSGRVVVRRRRRRLGMASALLLLSAGAVAISLDPGAGEGQAIDPAPTSSTTTEPAVVDGVAVVTSGPTYQQFLDDPDSRLAAMLPDGEVMLSPGVGVLDHVDNPYAYFDTLHDHSIALALRHDGDTSWVVLDYEQGDGRWSFASEGVADPASAGGITFREWVRERSQATCGCTQPIPQAVDLSADGLVTPAAGVHVIRQIDDPVDLGATGRSAGVEFTRGGERWWGLVQIDVKDERATGGGSFSATPVGATTATSLEQWIAEGSPVPPQSSAESRGSTR